MLDGYTDPYRQTAPAGSFAASPEGIYDLGGNVWEWVETPYGGGGSFAEWAVCRGGSWSNRDRSELWSSYRNLIEKDERDVIYGFRVVIERGDK